MTMTSTCKSCHYWRMAKGIDLGNPAGECHRYPMDVHVIMSPAGPQTVASWRPAPAGEWCGEYRGKLSLDTLKPGQDFEAGVPSPDPSPDEGQH